MSAPYIAILVSSSPNISKGFLNVVENRSFLLIVSEIQRLLGGIYKKHMEGNGFIYREEKPMIVPHQTSFLELNLTSEQILEASCYLLHCNYVKEQDPKSVGKDFDFKLRDVGTGDLKILYIKTENISGHIVMTLSIKDSPTT